MLSHGPATDRAPAARWPGCAGCGAVARAAAAADAAARGPRHREPGALKAATWRAAAAAEAERLRRLGGDPPRARVHDGDRRAALRAADERIPPAAHARHVREYDAARRAVRRLEGPRRRARSVLGTVDTLAAQHLLDPSRLRPPSSCCAATRVLDARGDAGRRRQRGTSGPAVFQYYPGRGMQLQPLASWGRSTGSRARACATERSRAAAACPVASCAGGRRPARPRRPRAATSSPGSTTSAGAAARRRGSAA